MAELELAEGVAEVPRDGVERPGRATSRPFLEWEWLASLEEAGASGGERAGQPRPLVVREERAGWWRPARST